MILEDGVEELALSGGLLRRKSWEEGTGLDLDDISAEDWELVETEDD
jgi:hypothetical protein